MKWMWEEEEADTKWRYIYDANIYILEYRPSKKKWEKREKLEKSFTLQTTFILNNIKVLEVYYKKRKNYPKMQKVARCMDYMIL